MNAQETCKKLYNLYRFFNTETLRVPLRESMKRYRREAALERQIAAQQRRIEQLQREIDYLHSTDHAADTAMERQHERRDQLDGWSDETPLGIALDGMGDEIE